LKEEKEGKEGKTYDLTIDRSSTSEGRVSMTHF
jgi:hypothetical protein